MSVRDTVRAYVDAHEADAVTMLQELTRIASPNPPGDERAIADACARIGAELGFTVEQVEGAPGRMNNILRWRGSRARPALLFNSHLDTPAVGDAAAWTHPPLGGELHDGVVWGVGARSNRAGIVAAFMAAKALRECGVVPRGELILVHTADELGGGEQGWGVLMRHGGIEADYGIFTEANPPPKMEVAARGHVLLRLTTRGQARHTKYKAERIVSGGGAVNAVATMARVVSTVESLEFTGWAPHPYVEGPPIVSVNQIEGGQSKIHMADRCVALADCRYLPGQDPDDMVDQIRAALTGIDVTVEVLRTWPSLEISPDEPMVRSLQQAIKEVTGQELPLGGIGSTSDLRWLVHDLGLSAGKFLFATSVTGVDERESVEDLMNSIRVYAAVMLDLLG